MRPFGCVQKCKTFIDGHCRVTGPRFFRVFRSSLYYSLLLNNELHAGQWESKPHHQSGRSDLRRVAIDPAKTTQVVSGMFGHTLAAAARRDQQVLAEPLPDWAGYCTSFSVRHRQQFGKSRLLS